jgi:hypothetical protein
MCLARVIQRDGIRFAKIESLLDSRNSSLFAWYIVAVRKKMHYDAADEFILITN